MPRRPARPAPPPVPARPPGSASTSLWPLGRVVDKVHPARAELEPLAGNRRAFAQATWRHLLFGVTLGELERRLNDIGEFEPLEDAGLCPNGHGNLEQAAVGAAES